MGPRELTRDRELTVDLDTIPVDSGTGLGTREAMVLKRARCIYSDHTGTEDARHSSVHSRLKNLDAIRMEEVVQRHMAEHDEHGVVAAENATL